MLNIFIGKDNLPVGSTCCKWSKPTVCWGGLSDFVWVWLWKE